MSAWIGENGQELKDTEKSFEDNFVASDCNNSKEFQKLDDHEQYLEILESKLKKIKKNSGILSLKELKAKREDCINNLLNTSSSITTEDDIELDRSIESNKIVSHIIPEQAQTIGEIVHLIKHDQLDLQKQEQEEDNKE